MSRVRRELSAPRVQLPRAGDAIAGVPGGRSASTTPIPGIGTIVAFTLVLEIDDIARFPNAKAFVSYCRLVPGAANSGGKVRPKRTKDGNRYLKLAFSHAAIRAIQYSPEIRRFYQALARRTPKAVARAVVAKELARMVYVVLSQQVEFNHTFKGKPLSTRKASQWPRLSSPSV